MTLPTTASDPPVSNQADEALNIATHIVDRHVAAGRGETRAMRFLGNDLDATPIDLTYAELADASARVATVLRQLGLERGETVFLLAGRVPRQYVAALATWKAGGVVCPLFAAFGPEPIRQRLELGDARILITTSSLYRRKILPIRDRLPFLRHVLIIDLDAPDVPADTLSLGTLTEAVTEPLDAVETRAGDPAILHFTSGTTGTPKGALHVHEAVESHASSGVHVLGLQPGDVYWCTADPGWVTGTSYGIIAPLAVGVGMVVDEAEFDAQRWFDVLERERVTVWYTAPTAIRMLMRVDVPELDLSALRLAFSVGEPLGAQAAEWGRTALGVPIRDTWWQTETGSIMIATAHDGEIRPGSMGTAVAGIDVALLDCNDVGDLTLVDGRVVELADPDRVGMIAIRPGWPSMFRAYLNAPERYRSAFADGWYLSGDLARRDADGAFWFVGRADDVIKTAGHLIGPFEVERVLNAHPDVTASGVYGVPDDTAGEVIHAEVVLRDGVDAEAEDTVRSLRAHARRTLGAALSPRSITPVATLPITRSGKVMRRLLRARALGLPEGDISTLEGGNQS
ncbi:AMP-binding protein [Ilumatobacter sp.]|uniref:AMP-binding protein n=1 Tax=Ilumatobacter sp. TaxID=1967498 RepID=UPI003AF9D7D5